MRWRKSILKGLLFLILLSFFVFLFLRRESSIPTSWRRLSNESYDVSSVTRIIHQSWKDNNVPERFRNYSKSWTQHCFKDWKYMFWTDEDNLNLIETHYPWFLKAYNKLPSAIHRADVMRYFYLFRYGGLYTDFDNECLKPFEHLLQNYSMVFGAMKDRKKNTILKEGYVQNSFMYSIPHHSFWLEMIMGVLNYPVNDEPGRQTGPDLLTFYLSDIIRRNGDIDPIKIYAPNYFNPFSWIDRTYLDPHCKDYNKMSFEDWQICKTSMIKRGAYVVQYHAHSWYFNKFLHYFPFLG